MRGDPILQFKSHTRGKNADVTVYPDRIECKSTGHLVRSKGSEVIPVKNISSVATKRDGFAFTKVQVICTGNTIDFRVAHKEAERIKNQLTSLLLGSHPALQEPAGGPPPPAPPPPVGPPAGWYPDPHGAAGQRYWDGGRWTDDTHA